MKGTIETINAEERALLSSHGVSVEAAANLLNRDLTMIYRWLGDENPPMPGYMRALLHDRLESVGSTAARP